MKVRKFYSVQDAYQRMGFWGSVEATAVVVTLGDIAFWPRNGWVAVGGGVAWWASSKARQTFSALFWNQAEMLHTSSMSGDPAIFKFMSKRHQRQLSQKSFDKFSRRR